MRDQMSVLDELTVPDDWAETQRRTPRLGAPHSPSAWRKGVVIATALTLTVGTSAVMIRAFRGSPDGQSAGGERPVGNALQPLGYSWGSTPLSPGERIGYLDVWLKNLTDAPLTLDQVIPLGKGLGTAVAVEKILISPVLNGIHSMYSGSYLVDPPSFRLGNICHSAVLLPVQGFQLAPGASARLWMVIRAVQPGNLTVKAHRILYQSEGVAYRQDLDAGYGVRVREHASPLRDDSERPCFGRTTPLNPKH
jgi:hypothetical protein